jgi:hypothetical protein
VDGAASPGEPERLVAESQSQKESDSHVMVPGEEKPVLVGGKGWTDCYKKLKNEREIGSREITREERQNGIERGGKQIRKYPCFPFSKFSVAIFPSPLVGYADLI